MYKAIVYKEWIKLRWFLLIMLGITLAVHLKIFIMLRSAVVAKGAYHLWYMAAVKQAVFYGDIMWLAPFIGLVTALAQFVPETGKSRLRILFHLPLPHDVSLVCMLGVGCLWVGGLCGVSALCLAVTMGTYFPPELVMSALVTAAPWFLASVPAYFGTVLAMVETAWWRKVVYGVVAYGLVLLMMKETMGFFEWSLGWYALAFALYLPTVLLPAHRFKRGIV
ncbi:hypothetical protein [Desulfoluna spongiiphila]|uniref:ABC-2 family transporter protein n=1 Tax=Desulfoluna spongiiphila TaxID=419481 RepID=A0A1G5HA27_9BACT|nr:hypothetical protein [Desulfoluna spongiiphila]SCY60633.1 hypothetical protein SAMN05216233_11345 [Desulfoluna spongiiphila]